MTEKEYDIFSVESTEDDIFYTGEVVESLAYVEDGRVMEIYVDDFDVEDGEINYSLREFGKTTVSEIANRPVDYREADDPEAILGAFDNSDAEDLLVEGSQDLKGPETADAFRR